MRHQNCPTSCDAGWRDGLVARRAHSPPFSRSGCAINKKDPVPWRRGPSLKTEGNGLAPTDVSDFEIACLRQSPEIRCLCAPHPLIRCAHEFTPSLYDASLLSPGISRESGIAERGSIALKITSNGLITPTTLPLPSVLATGSSSTSSRSNTFDASKTV